MTRIKALSPVLELKSLESTGEISGYASVFSTVDSHSEMTMPGCFAASLADHRRRGSRPKMFWQHDMAMPIGSWSEIHEDGKGLYVEGRLNMAVQKGREAYELLAAKDIDGLSIGYWPEEFEPDEKRPHITRLKRVKLAEVSIVSIGSCAPATIDSVKSELMEDEHFAQLRLKLAAGELPSVREWERGLKVAFSLSNSQAERAAAVLSKSTQGELGQSAKPADLVAALNDVRAALNGFTL